MKFSKAAQTRRSSELPATEGGQVEILRLAHVTRRFGSTVAVNDVTLGFRPGEIHGVVGENGAGKSTIVGLAIGTTVPSSGFVTIAEHRLVGREPRRAKELGVAAVLQEPALFPDLTVAENLWLKCPIHLRPPRTKMVAWATEVLDGGIDPGSRELVNSPAANLSVEAGYCVELASAMAQKPRVLFLDEPTDHLGEALVEKLFTRLRTFAEDGCAVVYISHRLRDVKRISAQISVMRDGALVATHNSDEISLDQLVELIAGHPVSALLQEKQVLRRQVVPVLAVSSLQGAGFSSIDFELQPGEIVGLAGIEGNGQREFLRGLAFLNPTRGRVSVLGKEIRTRHRHFAVGAGIEYVPRDRRREALYGPLSVRENLQLDSSPGLARFGFIRVVRERRYAAKEIANFRIRTSSPEAAVSSLSGGNAQKTVIARAMIRHPKVLLLDEPTQGVDVGSREEIYMSIRSATIQGAGAVIAGSDAGELAGLCDRVLVFSRGVVVAELEGDELLERNIVSSAVTAEGRVAAVAPKTARVRRRGDTRAWVFLLVLNIALAVGVGVAYPHYLSSLNISNMLTGLATLGFFSMAQQTLLLIGGVDLSVGPLAGLVVIFGSFLLSGGGLAGGMFEVVGLSIGLAVVAGGLNWLLGEVVGLTAFVGTLATYVLLQGIMITLRPLPGGLISSSVSNAILVKLGPIPVMVLVCALVAVVLEPVSKYSRWGVSLRGVGSAQQVASIIGLRPGLIKLSAYVLASLLAIVAGVLLLPQVGIGLNTAGVTYSISSISAAVVGGATMAGGRGSFISAFLGAAVVEQSLTASAFLGLGVAAPLYFLGGLILLAAVANMRRSDSPTLGRLRQLTEKFAGGRSDD